MKPVMLMGLKGQGMSSAEEARANLRLTPNEQAVYTQFRSRCVVQGIEEFTSDLFRMWGLDRVLYEDPQGKVGIFFWKLKELGFSEDTGMRVKSTMKSRHGAEIKVYSWWE